MLTIANRPPHYRRLDRDDPAPWTLALIRLWERGAFDATIAELLSDLSASAIVLLEQRQSWDWRAVEAACVPESGGMMWTRRQIVHYRRRLGLAGHRGVCSLGSPRNLLQAREREYQRSQGWGYLLPAYSEQERRWLPGCTLRRREVDILSVLRDHGAMTRLQLCRALGVRSLHTNGRAYLSRLQAMGLIYRRHTGRKSYHLTQLARRPDPWLQWQRLCQGE